MEAAAAGAGPGPLSGGLLQRTQVVLLSGEPWGLEGGQTVLSSFAHRALSPLGPSPPPSSGQLVFFLCRASSLAGASSSARLRGALEGLRAQLGPASSSSSVLVGIVVQPPPEEEGQALERLQSVLLETFPDHDSGPELHAALFSPAPGPAHGPRLRLQRLQRLPAARQARPPGGALATGKGRALWPDKALLMQLLGAALSFGTVAFGSYYFYNRLSL